MSAQPAPARPAPAQPGAASQVGPRPLWKDKPGGTTLFRHPAPVVLWWAWLAFALANLFYLIRDGINIHSLRGIALLAFITGIMYACTLHARVESDAEGVTIFNPVRRHRTPWGALDGIYLGDSVEFCCLRPAPKKPKTIYSWALYSRRRSAARMKMQRDVFVPKRMAAMSGRAPAEAASLAKDHPSKIMAAELGRRAAEARERTGEGGVLTSYWTWLPAAAIVVPGVLLLVAMLVK